MKTAFLFPGQGSQAPGMGEAFHDEWPEAREAFDDLESATDRDLRELCFGADADELRRTKHTQPAVYSVGIAVGRAVNRRYGVSPEFVAGHSLGHFTAAGYAGLYDPAEGLGLVSERGRAMEAAGQEDGPGRMVAVLFADPDLVAEACEATDGASVGAYNTPKQTVVSGHEDAVEEVCEYVEERDRTRTTDLDVGAAFHSPVMESAVEDVVAAIESTPMGETEVPVVSDVTGDPYTDPATARENLADQVLSPVDWRSVVETLSERGVERYVEFPPAGTLDRFVSRIDRDAEVVSLAEPGDAEAALGGGPA